MLTLFIINIEKVKEDAQKAEAAAAGGGLEDDDVWGDVEDVSLNFYCINQIIYYSLWQK